MDNNNIETANWRDKILKEIEVYFETEKYEQVISKALELLQEDAEDWDGFFYLSRSYTFLERYDEAEETIRQFISVYPNAPAGYMLMGELCTAINKYDEAISHFEQCISMEPEEAYYYYCKANALFQGSNFNKVVRWFPKLTLRPEYVARIERAIENLKKAHEYNPDNPGILLLFAKCYEGLCKPDKVLEYTRNAIILNPTSIDAHKFLAYYSLLYGDLDNANSHCEQVLMQEPNHSNGLEILNEIRKYESDTKKYYDAQIQYWKAICRFYPNNESYWLKLIDIKLSYGTDQPIKELKKYLKLKPEDWDKQITLGKALYDKKRYVTAIRHFKKLQHKSPENPYVQDWLTTLSKVSWLRKYVYPVPRFLFYYSFITVGLIIYLPFLIVISIIQHFIQKRKSDIS